jgi:NTE family protein
MDEVVLALGGGGVKGIAHVGVVRVLEKEGFKIRGIAGTSAGGLVGSLLATGHSTTDIEKLFEDFDNSRLFARGHHEGPALLGLQGINQILLDAIGDCTFDDCQIPFACTAVDLNLSQEVILAKGNLIDAVLATVAVPGIFPPRQLGDYLLVDGGVMDPVPVALARWLAPTYPVIAVCLSPAPEKWAHLPQQINIPEPSPIPRQIIEQFNRMRFGQALQIFVNSIDTTSRMLAELRMQQDHPDVIIRPEVEQYGILDKVNPQELILIGESAARKALPEIRQALSWSNQITRYFRKADPPGTFFKEQMEQA